MKLSNKDLEHFEEIRKQSEGWIYFEIGVALQYEYSPPGVRYSAPYKKMGIELWNSITNETYDLFCNRRNKLPKAWLEDLATGGDRRNLITGLVSALASQFDITLAITIPVAALIIKKGIYKYCSNVPPKKDSKTVKSILSDKKEDMKEFRREMKQYLNSKPVKKGKSNKKTKKNELKVSKLSSKTKRTNK